MNFSTLFLHKAKKAGVHRSKCTPAESLSFPTVSDFLFSLLLPCLLLLLLTQTLTDGVHFLILMEQTCHIPFTVVHHHRIVFLAVGGFHTTGGRLQTLLHFLGLGILRSFHLLHKISYHGLWHMSITI